LAPRSPLPRVTCSLLMPVPTPLETGSAVKAPETITKHGQLILCISKFDYASTHFLNSNIVMLSPSQRLKPLVPQRTNAGVQERNCILLKQLFSRHMIISDLQVAVPEITP
jgi:hypothetical protein